MAVEPRARVPMRRRAASLMTNIWRRHRGLTGLAGGVVIGVVATLITSAYIAPLFAASDELEAHDLVILTGRDDGAGHQRQALVDQWNTLHPRNPARIEELPAQADAQHSEMASRARQSHSGVDIYNLDVTWIAEFASEKYIRPLDDGDLDTSGFLRQPLDTCEYGDKLWALPFNTDAGLLYYRDDLVKTPPTSWPQLTAAAQAALAHPVASGPQPVAGYAGQLRDYDGLTVNALEAIWGAGGDVVDGDGTVVIDSKEAREGLKRLASGLETASPQIILPDSKEFDEARTTRAFAEGKVVFMRNWPVAHRALDPPQGVEAAAPAPVRFQVAKLPGPSVLGGQNLAIAADTAAPRAAQALIEFLTSDRSQQILFERGGFAATREVVYRDSSVVTLWRYAPTLLEAIRSARPRPVTPHYIRFSEEFREVVNDALRDGGQLPDDAVQRLTDALRGYRR